MLSPPDLGSLRWPRRTARLTLRPMTLDDVDAVLTFRGRADVARWLSHEAMTRDEVVDRVTDRVDRGRSGSARPLLGLVVAQRGIVVGDAMLRIDRCGSVTGTPAPEWEGTIGYTLHPDVQGQGLAGEVARALLTIAFADLGLRRVLADAYVENVASNRVLVGAGMRREGTQRSAWLGKDGTWLDLNLYAVLREEWREE